MSRDVVTYHSALTQLTMQQQVYGEGSGVYPALKSETRYFKVEQH